MASDGHPLGPTGRIEKAAFTSAPPLFGSPMPFFRAPGGVPLRLAAVLGICLCASQQMASAEPKDNTADKKGRSDIEVAGPVDIKTLLAHTGVIQLGAVSVIRATDAFSLNAEEIRLSGKVVIDTVGDGKHLPGPAVFEAHSIVMSNGSEVHCGRGQSLSLVADTIEINGDVKIFCNGPDGKDAYPGMNGTYTCFAGDGEEGDFPYQSAPLFPGGDGTDGGDGYPAGDVLLSADTMVFAPDASLTIEAAGGAGKEGGRPGVGDSAELVTFQEHCTNRINVLHSASAPNGDAGQQGLNGTDGTVTVVANEWFGVPNVRSVGTLEIYATPLVQQVNLFELAAMHPQQRTQVISDFITAASDAASRSKNVPVQLPIVFPPNQWSRNEKGQRQQAYLVELVHEAGGIGDGRTVVTSGHGSRAAGKHAADQAIDVDGYVGFSGRIAKAMAASKADPDNVQVIVEQVQYGPPTPSTFSLLPGSQARQPTAPPSLGASPAAPLGFQLSIKFVGGVPVDINYGARTPFATSARSFKSPLHASASHIHIEYQNGKGPPAGYSPSPIVPIPGRAAPTRALPYQPTEPSPRPNTSPTYAVREPITFRQPPPGSTHPPKQRRNHNQPNPHVGSPGQAASPQSPTGPTPAPGGGQNRPPTTIPSRGPTVTGGPMP